MLRKGKEARNFSSSSFLAFSQGWGVGEGRLETDPGRFRQAGRAFLVRRTISGTETEGEPRKAKRLRPAPFSKPLK